MSCNVAFIGLGVMGYPMAGYISKAGHNVTVYNRTSAKADKWIAEYKGSKADTPAKAAEGADFIFTSSIFFPIQTKTKLLNKVADA